MWKEKPRVETEGFSDDLRARKTADETETEERTDRGEERVEESVGWKEREEVERRTLFTPG